jgi:hypothetical protein
MESIDLRRSFKKANMSKHTHKTAFKPVLRIALTALALGASFCAFGQFIPYGQSSQPTQQYSQPNAFSGYSPDGVLYMGGQKIGNPHQILHDAEIPSFMTITANRYTYTNDPAHPNYGQGTLAQMETATTANTPADVLFNRLYLTANNPYPVVPTGTHNNFQTYQGALANAQTAGYKAITADDGKAYAVKTLTAATTQAQNILVRELPNTSQFRAAADPAGGAVGVRVTQNGDAVALANYMSTVTPYNFAAQPNFGVYGSTGSNVNNNNFANVPQYGNQIPDAWAAAMAWQNAHNGSKGNVNSENIASANFFNGMPSNWAAIQNAQNGNFNNVSSNGFTVPTFNGSDEELFYAKQWQQVLRGGAKYILPLTGSTMLVTQTPEEKLETARQLNESWQRGWEKFSNWWNNTVASAPEVPSGLVGDQGQRTPGKQQGKDKAHTSGVLIGGTGDPIKDGEKLGGTLTYDPTTGHWVGANDVRVRPDNSTGGVSIDIPAKGDKPKEVLHYPAPQTDTDTKTDTKTETDSTKNTESTNGGETSTGTSTNGSGM